MKVYFALCSECFSHYAILVNRFGEVIASGRQFREISSHCSIVVRLHFNLLLPYHALLLETGYLVFVQQSVHFSFFLLHCSIMVQVRRLSHHSDILDETVVYLV